MEQLKMDPLALPSAEQLREIAAKQDAQAQEIKAKRAAAASSSQGSEDAAQAHAAGVIQRNYRGYRQRRAMQGWSLDPSSRWALKEAQYKNATAPKSRHERASMSPDSSSRIRNRWKRATAIAHRAGNDDTSESESDVDEKQREQKRNDKKHREEYARNMGLDYFLEMVDHHHRYGSNLRRYHREWKQSDTLENFFYWLDYGEGKDLDLEDRPRKRLDTEKVRYLSKEERTRYLVNINEHGMFCWAKNGNPITTSPDFKDSINGIVPANDDTPTWREVNTGVAPEPSPPTSDSDSISGISTGSHEDHSKYTNDELHNAKGLDKLNHVSVDALLNHMLRKTTKKNTWIFVVDTSSRMYCGVKQSGAFQHSSFLKGARVSAAGLIKIKNGQLRKISPLSGHYAPPVRNFREFVKHLNKVGADMSRCNISRSYAVLFGLEGYLGAKKRVKKVERGVKEALNPEEKKKREEEEMDKSQSAAREREVLEKQAQLRRETSLSQKVKKSLRIDDDGNKQSISETRQPSIAE
ncbi:IQ domain-containing protein IQM4-like protein [Acrodontium crateriforme]|uniref:IQ domain-containing protein IQM4-like protein n=1 Tax=Acrodontium crateriforme TaxID=150365 RepID=A0AAQ3M7H1_9PEZI|nr:IQ domain-containing protein IQM4-like protein [Acrodontium crateriforme]